MFRTHKAITVLAAAAGLLASSSMLRADLVLETETAQLGKQGHGLVSSAIQIERDRHGNSTFFTLNQFEYAINDRTELLIEPFFYEWQHTKGGSTTHGIGDLEITPSYLVIEESDYIPALVASFKVKVPTANNRDIGTGKFDYQPFIIIGKTFGPYILNYNIGYNFITSPDDEPLRDQFFTDLSLEYVIQPKWSVFAETFYNSSPAKGEKATLSFAVATEFKFDEHWNTFISVGDNTDGIPNVRFGVNFEF